MSRSYALILRGMLWLIKLERGRLELKGGSDPAIIQADILAREIKEELEMEKEERVAARELFLAARRSEVVPVQEGRREEKEHGGTEG